MNLNIRMKLPSQELYEIGVTSHNLSDKTEKEEYNPLSRQANEIRLFEGQRTCSTPCRTG